MAGMKTETLLLLAGVGVGAYFLFKNRNEQPTAGTTLGSPGGIQFVIDWGSLGKGPENEGENGEPNGLPDTGKTSPDTGKTSGSSGSGHWVGTRYTPKTVPIARGEASYLASQRPLALTTGYTGQTQDITTVLGNTPQRGPTFDQSRWLREHGTQTLDRGVAYPTATRGGIPADIIPGKTVPDTLAWRQAAQTWRTQRELDRAQRTPALTAQQRSSARLSAGSVVARRTQLSAKERRLLGGLIHEATRGPIRLST